MLGRLRLLSRPAGSAAASAAVPPAASSAPAAAATATRSLFTYSRAHLFEASAEAAPSDIAAAAAAAAPPRPVSTRVFTKATLRRQALAQANPWYISHHALQKIRRGPLVNGVPVETKLPYALREHAPDFEMRRLRHLEATKLASDPQRTLADFVPGDRIVVTKYVSLNDRSKFERVAGLVLARSLGEDYELRMPLWSPFIARIDIVERNPNGENRRKKQYLLRDGLRPSWETRVPSGMSKPTATPQSIEQRARDNPGKIMVLKHFPMKKFVQEKRAGGIGAEMAAAGSDKKGGGAKPAPKKK
jgi:ribosomal protein L19